jgi:hypothetical protein
VVCRLFSRMDFLEYAQIITPVKNERDFRSFFGCPSDAINLLWSWMKCLDPKVKPDSLLMTLNFLKDPGVNWFTVASRWRVCEKTIKKKIEDTVELINQTLPEVYFLSFLSFLSFLFLILFSV